MEMLDIFNSEKNRIGVMERKQVHQEGHWHETFHCWFAHKQVDEIYLYVQKRQKGKDTFPEKFDITAAGHLLTTETPEDGCREIREELGVEIDFTELLPIGCFADEIITDAFIDREFCHTYLYKSKHALRDFILQPEEVAGIYLVRLRDVMQLFAKRVDQIEATGLETVDAQPVPCTVKLSALDFVPHQSHYYSEVFTKIQEAFA
ncbi:MAG: NUDIX hydrolase [Clostridia bacterium]